MENDSITLLEKVKKLKPVVIKNTDAAEAGRRVSDSVVQAFRKENLFHTWIPKALGGWEISPMEGV